MTSDAAVAAVMKALTELGIPFMLTGSLASNLYGVPRSTKDADFLLKSTDFSLGSLQAALGSMFRIEPQMSFEMVTMTSRHIIHKLHGEPVCVASAEDVIVTKLRWSKQGKRTKDVDDVRNVIAVQGNALDWAYIHRWCDEHGTRELLDQIRSSLPT